ncbi:MAG: hypothetical protein OWU32_00680 [Firmicutes bacterium]|nr:hypothetical protein [Bacillota bacterium]
MGFLRVVLTVALLFVGFFVISAVLSLLIKVAFLALLAAGVYFLLTRSASRDRYRWDFRKK